jgi:hypothetical protein
MGTQINIYRAENQWFAARWIAREYDGCDELDCDNDASEAEARVYAETMPLAVDGERTVTRVDDP